MLDGQQEDRRIEDRRKVDRRQEDKDAKYKEFRLSTLLISIIIIIAVIFGGSLAIKNIKNKKALDSIKQRHSGKYSCDFKLEGANTSIIPGGTATFEIKASNIKAEDGIIMFEGLLDYDYNIFECNIEDIENGKWHKVSLLEEYFTMARNDLMPSSVDQTIGKLVVKARENAPKGTYQLKLKNCIFTMENNKDFSINDTTVSIDIN